MTCSIEVEFTSDGGTPNESLARMAEALSDIARSESDLPASSARAGGRACASSGRLTLRHGFFRHAEPVYRNGRQGRQPDRNCGWWLSVRTRGAWREKNSRRCGCGHGHRRSCHQRADLALGNLIDPKLQP